MATSANRLTTITSPYGDGSAYNTVLTYHDDNTRETLTAQNGAVTSYTYDLNARLTSIITENTSTAVLQSSGYTYDDAGNVEYKSVFGGGSTTPLIYYQYDGASQFKIS